MIENINSTSLAHLNQNLLSSSITSDKHGSKEIKLHDFYIGLSLALLSSLFIGSSFILKKKGLLKLGITQNVYVNANGDDVKSTKTLRAGQGGYGYLKEWLWWVGLITMAVGEFCNFAAYGFVPATLVTPLGALSVLISAIMSAYFLNEKLNAIGKIGCLLTAIGSTVMVIHAPKEGEVKSVQDLLYRLQDREFITFTVLSLISLAILIAYMAPRYGNTNVLIYILICSILGAFTVMACKGLSLGIKEFVSDTQSTSIFFTLFFAIVLVVCIMVQMNYLNKSLDIFNTPIVTTVYYVLFTLFVMIASAVLFKEFLKMSLTDLIGCACGFTTIIAALCLIHFFKSSDGSDQNEIAMEKFYANTDKTVPSKPLNYMDYKFDKNDKHDHLNTKEMHETSKLHEIDLMDMDPHHQHSNSSYSSSSFTVNTQDYEMPHRTHLVTRDISVALHFPSDNVDRLSVSSAPNDSLSFFKRLASSSYKPFGKMLNRMSQNQQANGYSYNRLNVEADDFKNESKLISSRVTNNSALVNRLRVNDESLDDDDADDNDDNDEQVTFSMLGKPSRTISLYNKLKTASKIPSSIMRNAGNSSSMSLYESDTEKLIHMNKSIIK